MTVAPRAANAVQAGARRMGETLVREYETWKLCYPDLTRAMERAVFAWELTERQTLNRYFDLITR